MPRSVVPLPAGVQLQCRHQRHRCSERHLAAQQVARKVFEVYMTTTAAQLNNTCTVGLTNSIVSLQPSLHTGGMHRGQPW